MKIVGIVDEIIVKLKFGLTKNTFAKKQNKALNVMIESEWMEINKQVFFQCLSLTAVKHQLLLKHCSTPKV